MVTENVITSVWSYKRKEKKDKKKDAKKEKTTLRDSSKVVKYL